MKYQLLSFTLLQAAGLAAAACSKVIFDITAQATGSTFANPPNPEDESSILGFVGTALSSTGPAVSGDSSIGGTFEISGTYCTAPKVPAANPANANTLLLFVHGVTYSSTMWAGLSFSESNDWTLYANNRGFSTLAIDRLGYGDSSHPDPIGTVQEQLHTEIIHDIVIQIKSGKSPVLNSASLERIIYIGHSYGSFIGNSIASLHPDDFDGFILTGYSSSIPFPVPIINMDFKSASTVSSRFNGLPLGYVAASSESGRIVVLYGGNFDQALAHHDFVVEDTVTAGDFGTQGEGFRVAGFTGPVLVATGRHDVIFCAEQFGSCEDVLKGTGDLFPDSNYTFFVQEDAGHSNSLHRSATSLFKFADNWLAHV
jgi:pimeloyl-ACP methyl ester carboxylesterase